MEGDNRLNDWWAWEQAGRVPVVSGLACDQYRRFESDLDLAQSLAHNAYRFSIEWSRIEPSAGKYSEEALEHYSRVIRACRRRNIEPIVTLHHFTNPIWFAARGGWVWRGAVEAFARYAQKAAERFGREVNWWVTLNEPTVLVYYGYLEGSWPPGERSLIKGAEVLRNLISAHHQAYRAIHRLVPSAKVGLAHHMRCYEPCRRDSWKDRLSVAIRNRIGNRWTLRGCQGTMDFIGLNYYTRDFIRCGKGLAGLFGEPCAAEQARVHHPEIGARNMLGWEVYPEGLRRLLLELRRFRLPVLITENGVCAEQDQLRSEFIRDHLKVVGDAIAGGAEVAGYLYWSLIDNFEWADGFAPRFGLIEVDYATQQRRVRLSARQFAGWIRGNTK